MHDNDVPAPVAMLPDFEVLRATLAAADETNIGFPEAKDLRRAYRTVDDVWAGLLNNLGDPDTVDPRYPMNTNRFEVEAINALADLLRAPEDDRWGYVTSGGSEANLHALHLASLRHPDAIVYHTEATHHCITNFAIPLLGLTPLPLRTVHGEMDYEDLQRQVGLHRDCPAIVIANGGTFTEAVDDVAIITQKLADVAAKSRSWIHVDGAVSAIPLALHANPGDRPGFDFADGADSIAVSGHKFLGMPDPSGAVVVRDSDRYGGRASYTGALDATFTNSRSGRNALRLWYALCHMGFDAHRQRAESGRKLAEYLEQQLRAIEWGGVFRHTHGFTVVFDTPPAPVERKWRYLPTERGQSRIMCMPGVTKRQVVSFLNDMREALDLPTLESDPPASPPPPDTVRRSRGGRLRQVLTRGEAQTAAAQTA